MNVARMLILGLGAIALTLSTAQAAGPHKTPVAPAKYLSMENPIDADDLEGRVLKKVKRLYKSKCKKCHGTEGDGKGSAAEDIVLKPTSFIVPGYMEGRKDGQLFWIIKAGSKDTEMKAFGPGTDVNLSDEEMWKLVAYMRKAFTK
jgi:mono/diheme cytochrome c family protein